MALMRAGHMLPSVQRPFYPFVPKRDSDAMRSACITGGNQTGARWARNYLVLALLLLLSPVAVLSQGTANSDMVIVNSNGTLKSAPLAGVTVCTDTATGTPCSPRATIYSDRALSNQMVNPFNADVNGNVVFYAAPGPYLVQFSAIGQAVYNKHVVVPPDVTGPVTFSGNVTFTGSVTGAGQGGTNAQVGTTYTFASSDSAKLVTFCNVSSITATLPASNTLNATWFVQVQNRCAGTLTITSVSSIDGASSVVLGSGQGMSIYNTGSTYYTSRGMAASGLILSTNYSGANLTVRSQNACLLGGGKVTIPVNDVSTAIYPLTLSGSCTIEDDRGNQGSGLPFFYRQLAVGETIGVGIQTANSPDNINNIGLYVSTDLWVPVAATPSTNNIAGEFQCNSSASGCLYSIGWGAPGANLAGTASSSGTTVTGVGTAFNTDFAPEEYIIPTSGSLPLNERRPHYAAKRVITRTSNTSLTVDSAWVPDLPLGTTYAKLQPGISGQSDAFGPGIAHLATTSHGTNLHPSYGFYGQDVTCNPNTLTGSFNCVPAAFVSSGNPGLFVANTNTNTSQDLTIALFRGSNPASNGICLDQLDTGGRNICIMTTGHSDTKIGAAGGLRFWDQSTNTDLLGFGPTVFTSGIGGFAGYFDANGLLAPGALRSGSVSTTGTVTGKLLQASTVMAGVPGGGGGAVITNTGSTFTSSPRVFYFNASDPDLAKCAVPGSSCSLTFGAGVCISNFTLAGLTYSATVDVNHEYYVLGTGTEPTGCGANVLGTSTVNFVATNGGFQLNSITGPTWTGSTGVPAGNCNVGSIYSRTDAVSASTLLYACYPANTWNAVTIP